MCVRRLLARSGAATLVAWAVAAAFSPTAFGGGTFHRDRTPLPKQLSDPTSPAGVHAAGTGGTLARTIVGLAIVLAVVFGVYWLLKTYSKSKTKTGKGDGRMEIVSTTPLAPNRALHLVRIGEDLILVGSAENSVSALRTYSAEESEHLQDQLDAQDDPLWPVAVGDRPVASPAGIMAELRRRTARR